MLVPAVAVPVSIIATFTVLAVLGFSVNMLTLLALVLAIGLVVDDAIVVLENIYRHMEMGKKPMQASLVGAREMGFTIVSISISLVAVFIPIFFMPGVMGLMFHEFAVIVALLLGERLVRRLRQA